MQSKSNPKIITHICLGMMLGISTLGDAFADSDRFQIKESKWDRGDHELVAKGEGAKRRATVTLRSAASGTVIGSVRADKEGKWKFKKENPAVIPCDLSAESGNKSSTKRVTNAPSDCDGSVAGGGDNGGGDTGGGTPTYTGGKLAILAANDLGMHCADQDYRIFSILPPYNVINAQVIEMGQEPRILSPADGVEVTYSAIQSNIQDPNGANLPPIATDSVTSTSQNAAGIFKSNFWDPAGYASNGFKTYEPLYPVGVLGAFPFEADLGLPAPDLVLLYFGPDGIPNTGDEALAAHQTAMPSAISHDPLVTAPYSANEPQLFEGYVEHLPFFINLPIGATIENFKRFTAEGIPILPTDDQGRENAYPLYRVEARDQGSKEVLAQVDVVLPVASEADCQQCHASQQVCDATTEYTLTCDDIANTSSYVTFIEDANDAPGETPEQRVINAAKINILRLHDDKHGTDLDVRRNIVCASCHYTPALDLAHLGPNDDNGKEQTQHISMSRAMHASHGNLNKLPKFDHLFPDMPPPSERTVAQQEEILQAACYNCHPGKRTKCLRGAMGGGGIVCQDCHGQMAQVGDDFTENFPIDGSMDLTKRVPWASEPMCQSCHIGDVRQVAQLKNSGQLNDVSINATDNNGNPDGLRLNMAYNISAHSINGGSDSLALLNYSDSRFASNKALYRLSGGDDGSDKGHGGLSCEGCHGSTHAIWPNKNALANDNATSTSVQGHTGTIIECTVCHEGSLGNTLEGPHGMHPVGNTSFSDGGHEDIAENNPNACRACHGQNGEGSVLSRTATTRTLQGKEDNETFVLAKGTPVTCTLCHENEL